MNEEIIAMLWQIDAKIDKLYAMLKALEQATKKEANDEH
jgi:hypothetical protein